MSGAKLGLEVRMEVFALLLYEAVGIIALHEVLDPNEDGFHDFSIECLKKRASGALRFDKDLG